jgi:aminobenzoyl-glutamate utilization protein B
MKEPIDACEKNASIHSCGIVLFGAAACTAEKATPNKEKEFVFKIVERNSKAIALLGDNIYYFAELGMQEFETAKLMTQILEEAGFKVERGISGMPTAFMATYGSGKPVVAVHTEYDTPHLGILKHRVCRSINP